MISYDFSRHPCDYFTLLPPYSIFKSSSPVANWSHPFHPRLDLLSPASPVSVAPPTTTPGPFHFPGFWSSHRYRLCDQSPFTSPSSLLREDTRLPSAKKGDVFIKNPSMLVPDIRLLASSNLGKKYLLPAPSHLQYSDISAHTDGHFVCFLNLKTKMHPYICQSNVRNKKKQENYTVLTKKETKFFKPETSSYTFSPQRISYRSVWGKKSRVSWSLKARVIFNSSLFLDNIGQNCVTLIAGLFSLSFLSYWPQAKQIP